MAPRNKKKPKRKRRKATPQELEQRKHRSDIRAIFRNAGFEKVFSVSDKEFTYKSSTSDFDDVFVYENVIVFAEYTTSQSSKIGQHLRNKSVIYREILKDPVAFISFFEDKFPRFRDTRNQFYDPRVCQVIILYCPRNSLESKYKKQVSEIKYLDYPVLRYFKSVSDAVKLSSRFELLHFLGLDSHQIGENSLTSSATTDAYRGFLLPETHSNFDAGFKVVSFYVDPDSLLSRAYVLRKDGWREGGTLYQRIISRAKIASIRRYLDKHERVFCK